MFAGIVLIAVRPFKVGDRVRLQAGALAGQIEGVVSSLGLLYTTFAQGGDSVMVPNNVVLSAAVVPLREPASVDLRARLRPDVKPSDVQAMLEQSISTPVRGEPTIALEEIDADEVVVRIQATPLADADGPRLADEVLAAVGAATHEDEGRTTLSGLALVRLAALELRRRSQPRRSGAGPRRRARDKRGDHRARTQGERGDVELGAVGLDRLHDRAGDVLGALGADAGRELGARLGEHAGVADEAGEDDGDADALGHEVLAQGQREAAQPELRRRVDRRARARRRGPRART